MTSQARGRVGLVATACRHCGGSLAQVEQLRAERDHYRSAYEGLAEAAENVLVAIGWGETLRLGYSGQDGDVEDFEAALDQLRAAPPDPKEDSDA